MKIQIVDKRLGVQFQFPRYETPGSAAFDLRAMSETNFVIHPDEVLKVSAGFRLLNGDPNIAGLILPRSGWGLSGLILANGIGLIDSDYQGLIMVPLWNRSDDLIKINVGDRIAQMLFIPCVRPSFNFIDDDYLNVTDDGSFGRGIGGFGSTGIE